ncbi:MAG: hypothetical protein KF730_16710 [Sphingomonas sp.]|nr:hypothetical protein [Sphingomonas sp.]MBX3566203.1 hypothetical protein [Sphingomonas sp.]
MLLAKARPRVYQRPKPPGATGRLTVRTRATVAESFEVQGLKHGNY